jgi:hypothetical protein
MSPAAMSPAIAGFSFDTNAEPSSPILLDLSEPHHPVREHKDIMRPIDWDAPGSPRDFDSRKGSRATDSRRMTKMSYYEDSFAYKDDWESSTREKVCKESPVFIELRTNVIVSLPSSTWTDLPFIDCL